MNDNTTEGVGVAKSKECSRSLTLNVYKKNGCDIRSILLAWLRMAFVSSIFIMQGIQFL